MNMRASAARYAKALLDVTIRETDPEHTERELAAVVALLRQYPALHAALVNPAVPAAGKRAVVAQLLDRLTPSVPVGKLLLLLADRDKLAILPDLLAVYRERLREHQHVVRAEVTTATPLPEARAEQLRERLARSTGRTVTMTTKVDPSIIGGMITRIGSTVYDGSVVTQLQAIKRRLAR
jgi:F-type H+-transporting ATPase subunit delta